MPNLDSLVSVPIPMRHSTPPLLIILFSALPLFSASGPSGNEGLASRLDAPDNDGIRLAISPGCVLPWKGSKEPSYEINASVNWSKMRWVTLPTSYVDASGLLGSFRTVVVFGDSVSRPTCLSCFP